MKKVFNSRNIKMLSGNIGVFGGSFDPLHQGHINVALSVKKKIKLDKVIFFIAQQNWLKNRSSDCRSRVLSAENVIAKIKGIYLSDLELEKNIKFTYDLIRHLESRAKNIKIYFIAGSDILKNFRKWKNFKELLRSVYFIVYPREGSYYNNIKSFQMLNPKFYVLNKRRYKISSTQIRNKTL